MAAKMVLPVGDDCGLMLAYGSKSGVASDVFRHDSTGAWTVRERESLMGAMLICGMLWAWFLFQFVIGVCYDIPALYVLSGGHWKTPSFDFYQVNDGPFPWSLAHTLVYMSMFGCLFASASAWFLTHGRRGKWRMRLAVLIFITIAGGWSAVSLRAEDGKWRSLEKKLELVRQQWTLESIHSGDEFRLKNQRQEVERLEALLAARRD